MALNKWLGAVLIASIFGLTGCATPKKKDGPTTKTPAPVASTAPAETPDATPEATPEATPSDSATAAATPAAAATGTPVAAAGGSSAEMLEDLENADGMEGYEEVMKMTVPPSSDASIAAGKELFAANCASCHGDKGMGDGPAGAALDPKPRNLTVTDEYKYGHMELAGYRTVHYGVEGTGMAPLGDQLSPEEIWNVVHFVKTLQG